MKKISILDYGCEIYKYKSCFKKIGYESEITNKKNRILNTDFLILPGVGAFENAMKLLRQNDLVNVLNEFVLNKKKIIRNLFRYANFTFKKLRDGSS